MWFGKILGHQVTRPLGNILLFANDSNSSAATTGCGFHNVHFSVAIHFSLLVPTLVILGENVSIGAYLEVFAMPPPLPLDIAP